MLPDQRARCSWLALWPGLAWPGPARASGARRVYDPFVWSFDHLKTSSPRGKRAGPPPRRVMGFGREKYKKEK